MMFSKTQISLQKGVWPSDSRKFLSKGAHMLKSYNRHTNFKVAYIHHILNLGIIPRYAEELPSKP